MADPVNVLIMIHGMTPGTQPWDAGALYDAFWNSMTMASPDLGTLTMIRKGVQWGHPLPPDPGGAQADQRLTGAQNFINEMTSCREVRKHPGPNNIIRCDPGIPGVRPAIRAIRENVVLRGMGDAVYYCSSEGEQQVRAAVFRQVFEGLERYLENGDVRFHLFGHSLGVTLCHDLLYGLFCSRRGYAPGFLAGEQGAERVRSWFSAWRRKAGEGSLTLGSMASAASQLPLFVLRKKELVDCLYQRSVLDPRSIGIRSDGRVQWKIFYDVDDLLGFATRRLYEPHPAIQDVQVACSCDPRATHDDYWNNETVIRETAAMIVENAR